MMEPAWSDSWLHSDGLDHSIVAGVSNASQCHIAEGVIWAFASFQAVGPVAVTSLLLGNTQHGLGHLAGVSFPASVINPDTNKTVAYSPNSPGIYDFEQTQINNAAHNVRVQTFISLLNTILREFCKQANYDVPGTRNANLCACSFATAFQI